MSTKARRAIFSLDKNVKDLYKAASPASWGLMYVILTRCHILFKLTEKCLWKESRPHPTPNGHVYLKCCTGILVWWWVTPWPQLWLRSRPGKNSKQLPVLLKHWVTCHQAWWPKCDPPPTQIPVVEAVNQIPQVLTFTDMPWRALDKCLIKWKSCIFKSS